MSAWLWVMAGGAVGAAARYGTRLGLAPLAARSGWVGAAMAGRLLAERL